MDISRDILIYQILPFLDFRELTAFESTCKEFNGNLNQNWFDLLESKCKITFARMKDKPLVIPFSKQIFRFRYEKRPTTTSIYFMRVKRGEETRSELLGCYNRESGNGIQAFLYVATAFPKANKLFYHYEENNKVDKDCSKSESCRCEECLIQMLKIITKE